MPTKIPLEIVIEWDVENWSGALDHWSANTDLAVDRGRALEIGARNGGLSLWLAAKGWQVICSDVSAPKETVKQLHATYGMADNIAYITLDGCHLPFADGSFDLVVFKSVLGALRTWENQLRMCREIYRVLRPGGEVWFAENLRASMIHQAARKLFIPWTTYWRYLAIDDLTKLYSEFQTMSVETYGFSAAFGRTERQRRILGKIDRCLSPCIPSRWKYIAFGLAKK